MRRSTASASRSTAPRAKPAFEHDGTAAIVYGMRQPRFGQDGGFDGGAVVILDWDIRSLALGSAGAWLRHVNDLYRHWVQRARPRMGLDGIWIEKPAMGLRLLEIAGEQRIAAQRARHTMGRMG